jgi:hypothetical protein
MKKKVYHYHTDKGGMRHCWVNVFQSSNAQDCTMCKGLNNFIDVHYEENKDEVPKKILNLAREDLKRHLASGKHWELIDGYLKTKGEKNHALSQHKNGIRYIPSREHRPAQEST